MKKRLLGFTALLLLMVLQQQPNDLMGQDPAGLGAKEEARKICDDFLQHINKSDVKAALKSIKPYISVPEKDFSEVIDEVVRQRTEMAKRFGKTLSIEFLQEESVKDTLLKYTYMEKYQIHVIRWSFIFYKPQEKWLLNSFYWDENIRVFFK